MRSTRSTRRIYRQDGFTLLEVMVALAILAVSLTWMIEATTRAVTVENHAKLMSTATFLARSRMVELEDELAEKGFTDDSFAKEVSGDFEEKGFKRFKWATVIDKIELPNTDQVQTLVSQGLESQQNSMLSQVGAPPLPPSSSSSSGSGSSPAAAGSAGMLASQFGMIKDVLEQSIRRARVTITWNEGRADNRIEIIEYLTDPKRVDQSIQMGIGGGAAGAAGAAGAGGPAGASGGAVTGGSSGGALGAAAGGSTVLSH